MQAQAGVNVGHEDNDGYQAMPRLALCCKQHAWVTCQRQFRRRPPDDLGHELGGNPRRVKRFLNTVELRGRVAVRRGTPLRMDVLAKLAVLEDRRSADYQRLFDWTVAAGGKSPELAAAERHAAGTADPNDASDVEGAPEGPEPALAGWAGLDPIPIT